MVWHNEIKYESQPAVALLSRAVCCDWAGKNCPGDITSLQSVPNRRIHASEMSTFVWFCSKTRPTWEKRLGESALICSAIFVENFSIILRSSRLPWKVSRCRVSLHGLLLDKQYAKAVKKAVEAQRTPTERSWDRNSIAIGDWIWNTHLSAFLKNES